LTGLGLLATSSASFADIVSPTVPIPGVFYQGIETTAFWTGAGYIQGSDNIGPTGPPANSRGGSISGSGAHASYGSSLTAATGPMITVSTDTTGADFFHPSSSIVQFTMTYFFVATGPGVSTVVDLSALGFGSSVVGGALERENLTIDLASGAQGPVYSSPSSDWTANTSFSVFTNEVYGVQLFAQVQSVADGTPDGFESATATIDPLLSIDPSNPNAAQYGLFLSSGIPAPVPLPAGLPLLASGLGIFGLLGRRGRELYSAPRGRSVCRVSAF
jgi:hypothetical protein